MLALSSQLQYHMYCTAVDMRKGFDGLCGLVINFLKKDPTSGDVFIFLNKNRNLIKLLYWDGDGFVIYYKRLERGTYDFLEDKALSKTLKKDELMLILEGYKKCDFKKKKRYKTA
jgi:transposase